MAHPCLSCCLCFSYSQGTDFYRYTHRIGSFNAATVGQPYLFIGISLFIYFVSRSLSLNVLLLSQVIACLLVAAILLQRLQKEIGLHLRLPSWVNLTNEIAIGFPLILSFLVDVVLSSGDRYVIAATMSVRDVALYAPAYALGSLVIVLPKVFGVVLPPVLAKRIDSGDIVGARQLMNQSVRILLIISVPFVMGSWILGEKLLRLYSNDEIAKAAWPVIPLVALASIFYGLILINANLLFIRLKTGALFRINAVAALLNIVLNIVLLQIFKNVIIAAITTLLSYFVSYLWLRQIMISDEVRGNINIGWLLRLIVASIMMGVLSY